MPTEWYVGVITVICHELFHFEKGPTPGSVHKARIRLRGVEAGRGADTCQKASQPDGSDLSVSAQGREGAQACRALPRGFQAARPWGGWASALTPELPAEAGAAAAGRGLLFLKFSSERHLYKGRPFSSNLKCHLLHSFSISLEAPRLCSQE